MSINREQVTHDLSALAKLGLPSKHGAARIVRDLVRPEHMLMEVRSGA